MVAHKYAAGQSVRYSPLRYEDNPARGLYTIVRLLPDKGIPSIPHQGQGRRPEQVVREDQLDRASYQKSSSR